MIKNTDCRGPAGQKRFHCGRGIFVWETMPRACAGVLPGMPPPRPQNGRGRRRRTLYRGGCVDSFRQDKGKAAPHNSQRMLQAAYHAKIFL